MKKIFQIGILTSIILFSGSCTKYLEIVPDNVAELEMAFNLRNTAERYLATCYSYLPSDEGAPVDSDYRSARVNPAFYLSLEATHSYLSVTNMVTQIAMGNQRADAPFASKWNNNTLWTGIRHCNIFMDNIESVPDMTEQEKLMWKAEVNVLRAYYHFLQFQQVGPMPIIDKNIELGESSETVKVRREKVDDVINFIVKSIDDALPNLQEMTVEQGNYGRLTKVAALAFKAKVLTTAASPFYNGNTDYANFKNENGENFFNQAYDATKWQKAANASKEAITLAEQNGAKLFRYNLTDLPAQAQTASQDIKTSLDIRGSLTERYNSEILWANVNSINNGTHFLSLTPKFQANFSGYGCYSVSVNTAEEFYSKNGVPIEEDPTWDYQKRYDMITTPSTTSTFLIPNYKTAKLNLDRENRFYATLGFDGGTWYGQGVYDEPSSFKVMSKKGQAMVSSNVNYYNLTGYFAKKLVPFKYELKSDGSTNPVTYPWPIIRLSDLYLYYAEALNEVSGPSDEVFQYVNAIRERAGLKGVKESWTQYSNNPNKPNSKEGLREIIRKERRIELALEGQKFWDFIRWKIADEELSKPLLQWDTSQETSEYYYRILTTYIRQFSLRDYLWPINESSLFTNKNLIQNPGW
ncbi:RagB/SusD family nutrient uptake outer membrane protein [Sphingobacterium kyonggiense]